jgi:hypothetical protein
MIQKSYRTFKRFIVPDANSEFEHATRYDLWTRKQKKNKGWIRRNSATFVTLLRTYKYKGNPALEIFLCSVMFEHICGFTTQIMTSFTKRIIFSDQQHMKLLQLSNIVTRRPIGNILIRFRLCCKFVSFKGFDRVTVPLWRNLNSRTYKMANLVFLACEREEHCLEVFLEPRVEKNILT